MKAEGVDRYRQIRTESRKPRVRRPSGGGDKHRKRFQEKPLSITAGEPVPKTDTGGPVENTKAYGRFTVKELGKIAP